MSRTIKDSHAYHLLVPLKLWKKIKQRASKNRRSIRQEILMALEYWIEHQ